MEYHSKYTGEEVEALLDSVKSSSSAGMFESTDVVLDGDMLKIRNLVSNRFMYLAYNQGTILQRVSERAVNQFDPYPDRLTSAQFQVGTSSGDNADYVVTPSPSFIGVGSFVRIREVSSQGLVPSLYGVAFCDSSYSSWDAIPARYKCVLQHGPQVRVNLNGQWVQDGTIVPPGYDTFGSYKSNSNHNVDSGVSTMYLYFSGYERFSILVRSDAESTYDYLNVSKVNSQEVEYSTSGKQNSGEDLGSYHEVVYDGLQPDMEYMVTLTYLKDNVTNTGADRAFLIVPRQ